MEKAELNASSRNALPDSAFAIPATREYPIHDESHARNALARVSQYGTDREKQIVRGAVKRRYPNLEMATQEGENMGANAKKQGKTQAAILAGGTPSPESVEGQGKENHPKAGAIHMDVQRDGSVVISPNWNGAPATVANGEGRGTSAPYKTLDFDEAKSQAKGNLRKEDSYAKDDDDDDPEDGDGHGSPAPPYGHSSSPDDLAEAVTQTQERTNKSNGDASEPEDRAVLNSLVLAYKQVKAAMAAQKADPDNFTEPLDAQVWAHLEDVEQALKNALLDQSFDLSGIDVYPASASATDQASKEIDDMTQDELLKMLDERDARLAKSKAKAKAKAAKKAKKKAKMKKEAKALAKAADPAWVAKRQAKAEAKAAKKAAKVSPKKLAKVMQNFEDLQKQVEKIGGTPMPTPVLNAAGIIAAGGVPALRKAGEEAGGAFAPLEANVEKALATGDPLEFQKANQDLATARLIAMERLRASGMSNEEALARVK